MRIGVVGLGYVGLPLAQALARAGHQVLGLDVDPERTRQLREDSERGFVIVDDIGGMKAATAYFLCVPTPNDEGGAPELSALVTAARDVGGVLKVGDLVVCESTTPPGGVDTIVAPALRDASGLKIGEDVLLSYSPERIDPGREGGGLAGLPKLVAGQTSEALEAARAIYSDICPVVPVRTIRTAEAAKQVENVFRLVNIALINEMKSAVQALGLDIDEVLAAAATKPFGYMPFEPGPGVGGHCIPVDPAQFAWAASHVGVETPLIRLALDQAAAEPGRVVDRLARALAGTERDLAGASILVLGATYKRDVADTRNSPAVAVMAELRRRGASVAYVDPLAPEIRLSPDEAPLCAIPLDEVRAGDYDAVLVATDHALFDWPSLLAEARLVIDTRNVTAGLTPALGQRFVRA